jgi:hypothetical protein
MGFLAESGRAHVRDPDLDRAQTLGAQPLTVAANLQVRGLDSWGMSELCRGYM